MRSNLNEKLPDLSFRLVADDSQHFLHEFEGRVVILNLWATWCPGCVREMPSLNQLQSDCTSQSCVVITISDESADRLRTFARSHPTNTVNGYVDRFDWVQMGTFRPFTLIIDGRGILREYAFEEVDSGRYEAKARRYLH